MINVLFSGNSKVLDGAMTTMLSILKRTETKEPFTFYIYTMDITRIKPDYTAISDEAVEFLDRIAKSYNIENKVEKVDVGEIYEKEFANCPNEMAYCSPYTLLRLFADIVPNMPDKLLYLDIDIMFNRDVTLLYNQDVTDYEYAAARDHYGKFFINPNYINAGVILFNLKKCKETGLLEKARHLIKTKKMLFADQDAIYHSTTKKLMLPQKFNDQKFLHKNTVVRHFSKRLFWLPYPHTDNIKQWKVSRVHKVFGYYQFDDILYEYIYLKKLFEQEQKEENFMNNKDVVIFFSCDDNYIPYLAVSLESLEENADKNRNYKIKVLHTNTISANNQTKILAKYNKGCFDVEFVDISQFVAEISNKLYTRDYYSKSTYYRLFIPNLYPQFDKALYLDSDIVVKGDISKLFDVELGTNYVGAIPDESVQLIKEFQDYVENHIHVDSYKHYFNAGILLMNLDVLRKDNFEEMFINMLANVKFTVAQDQDYLNAICAGRVTYIDSVWDKMPFPSSVKEEDIQLIHFNLDMKPWHRDGVLYEKYFWDYAKRTDYFNEILYEKENFPKEKLDQAAEQTKNLIAKTKQEAEDTVENKRILDVINKYCRK